jgi:hypothetical protein
VSFLENVELLPPAAFARQILLRKNKIPEEKRAKAETAMKYKDSVKDSSLGCEFLILPSENLRHSAVIFIVL